MRFAVLFLCGLCGWVQDGWAQTAPFLGQMIDAQNRLRAVSGMSGNFGLGTPVRDRVLSSACSRGFCVAKTESSLVSGTNSVAAPPGGAILAPDAAGATVYFPVTRQFARWQNGAVAKLDLSVEGTVLSMAENGTPGLSIAVERSGSIWVVAQDGTILDALPPGATAVLLLPDAKVYATSDSLVLRKSDGSELRFPAPGVASLTAMSDSYVEARTQSGIFALRVIAGREQLFALAGGNEP